MHTKWIFASVVVLLVGVLAACGGTNVAPTAQKAEQAPTVSNQANSNAGETFAAQTVEGGSVAVKVTPLQLNLTAPLEFEITMDTHSVELADDMLKAVVLRDEAGKEYAPIKWDGPGAGGHHREGKIKFAALATNPKTLTLVVKNIAGVSERVFKWDVAQ